MVHGHGHNHHGNTLQAIDSRSTIANVLSSRHRSFGLSTWQQAKTTNIEIRDSDVSIIPLHSSGILTCETDRSRNERQTPWWNNINGCHPLGTNIVFITSMQQRTDNVEQCVINGKHLSTLTTQLSPLISQHTKTDKPNVARARIQNTTKWETRERKRERKTADVDVWELDVSLRLDEQRNFPGDP